jgi:tetratricopeptide (TPR) repeat protein
MPYMSNSLWGASGYLKSSMNDLLKLLSFELDKRDKLSQESQRNLVPGGQSWNGYFWDRITVNNEGLVCVKHGGGFGTQNLFAAYPDFNMGVSIIVNESNQNTASYLHQALNGLVDDLKPYGKKDIGRAVYQKCVQNIDSGIQFYHYLKQNKTDLYNFSDESGLNSLGYKLMGNGQIASAIKIFKLVVSEFPNSGNAYDSLGEAYFNNKEYALAKASYVRSLELIPGNENAKNMLSKINNITK